MGIAVLVEGATERVATECSVPLHKRRPFVVDCQAACPSCISHENSVVNFPCAGVVEGSTQFNCEMSVQRGQNDGQNLNSLRSTLTHSRKRWATKSA